MQLIVKHRSDIIAISVDASVRQSIACNLLTLTTQNVAPASSVALTIWDSYISLRHIKSAEDPQTN